jgi:hypothetical protein
MLLHVRKNLIYYKLVNTDKDTNKFPFCLIEENLDTDELRVVCKLNSEYDVDLIVKALEILTYVQSKTL